MVIERFSRIDILVNNASVSYKTKDGLKIPILDIHEEQFLQIILPDKP